MTRRWFTAVAIAEGLSLIGLFGIAMPAKYVFGMENATKLIGMVHGALFFVYLIALWSTCRVDNWSWAKTVLGFVVSLIPFAPFVFAKKLHG